MAPIETAQSAAPAKPKRQFSQAIQDYVARTFEAQYDGIENRELTSKLNQVITERLKNGQEHTTDWTAMPLPQEIILQERKAAAVRANPGWMMPPPFVPAGFPSHIPPPMPPHLPLHLPPHFPPPPPPTNLMPAVLGHGTAYIPPPIPPKVEHTSRKNRKRRTNQHDSVDRSPSPRRRSGSPSGKRQRLRSPTRDDNYRKTRFGKNESDSPFRNETANGYHDDMDMDRSHESNLWDDQDRYRHNPSPKSTLRQHWSPTPNRQERNGIEDRVTRHKKTPKSLKKKEESRKYQQDLERRKQRFANDTAKVPKPEPNGQANAKPMNGRLVGTNTELEKDYYRLTSDPKPELVRPQKVLEKTLVLLKEKWGRDRKYNYMKSQLKSMRQDLTVQHIKNAFTIEVYETHARIALEMSDLGEYNQCQTQLRALYKSVRRRLPTEFIAYRILYFTLTLNTTGQCDILMEMNETEKDDEAVKNALSIRSALAMGNYYRFFQLTKDVPNLGRFLVASFINRTRLAAIANYARATKYPVPETTFTTDFGFDSAEEGLTFLQESFGEGMRLDSMIEQKDDGQRVVYLYKMNTALRQVADAAARRIDIKGQI